MTTPEALKTLAEALNIDVSGVPDKNVAVLNAIAGNGDAKTIPEAIIYIANSGGGGGGGAKSFGVMATTSLSVEGAGVYPNNPVESGGSVIPVDYASAENKIVVFETNIPNLEVVETDLNLTTLAWSNATLAFTGTGNHEYQAQVTGTIYYW